MKRFYNFRFRLLGILCMLSALPALAQSPNQFNADQFFPQTFSPNAAELGQYGKIPVDYFSGLASISIPLTELKASGYNLPISLTYHSSGNQPERHPGWVGQGWSLRAGGSITRTVNGLKDEMCLSEYENIQGWTNSTYVGVDYDPGYFYHFAETQDQTDWTDADNLYQKAWLRHERIDYSPDEFRIELDGISASFYFTGENEIRIVSKNPVDFSVEVEVGSSNHTLTLMESPSESRNNLEAQAFRHIKSFVVKDRLGNRYYFGGDDTAIEYSILVYPQYVSSGTGTPQLANVFRAAATANTWLLTRIERSNGEVIDFTYKRDGMPMIVRDLVYSEIFWEDLDNTYPSAFDTRENPAYKNNLNFSFILPSYLTSISSKMSGDRLDFDSGKSTELPYDITNEDFMVKIGNYTKEGSTQFTFSDWQAKNYYLQLNGISGTGRNISFEYTNSLATRLKLLSLSYLNDDRSVDRSYVMSYNSTPLPAYNSKKTDKWGYYNDISYADSYDSNGSLLESVRVPVADKIQAEMLTSITYPTGGRTELIYEPHLYSATATQFPFGLQEHENMMAGGLRIKEIRDYASDGKMEKRTFTYLKSGSTSSSGILAGNPKLHIEGSVTRYLLGIVPGIPSTTLEYLWNKPYTANYELFGDTPLVNLSDTYGNHITYSRVCETFANGGSTVYKYSNHDTNIYRDNEPTYAITNMPDGGLKQPFNSRELFRGLLLGTELRDSLGTLVREETMTYRIDTTQFLKSVETDVNAFDNLISTSYTKIFCGFPYLEKRTVRDRDDSGQYITTTETSTYNNYRQTKSIERSTGSSTGAKSGKIYYYPEDRSGDSYAALVTAGMQVVPVGEANTVSGNIVEASELMYKTVYMAAYDDEPIGTIQVPDKLYRSELNAPVTHGTYNANPAAYLSSTPEITFTDYDRRGKLFSYVTADGLRTSCEWDDQGLNPKVVLSDAPVPTPVFRDAVKNETLSVVYPNDTDRTIEFETSEESTVTVILSSNYGYNMLYSVQLDNELRNILSIAIPENPPVTPWDTYAGQYQSQASFTVPAGKHTLKMRLTNIRTSYGNLNGTTGNLSYSYSQFEANSNGGLIPESAYTDGTQFTKYEFIPFIGPSQISDSRDVATHYEYDDQGRLTAERDHANRLINSIAYHFGNTQDERNYISRKTFTNASGSTYRTGTSYFDGLGRNTDNVTEKGGGTDWDIVSRTEYDDLGRPYRQWIDEPVRRSDGQSGGNTVYDSQDQRRFTQQYYESAPRNRVLRETGPGNDWKNADKHLSHRTYTNTSSASSRHSHKGYTLTWSGSGASASLTLKRNSSLTAAQTLSISEEVDEDGHAVLTFTNHLGQTVLIRRMESASNSVGFLDTHYIYDALGRLSAVLPPKLSERVASASQSQWTESEIGDLAYIYRYDNRGNCIARKLPGAGWEYSVYDKGGRKVLTQDAVQRQSNQWTFSIGDKLGRTVLTGTVTDTSLNAFAEPYRSVNVNAVLGASPNYGSATYGYTLNGITLNSPDFLDVIYYDNYNVLNSSVFTQAEKQEAGYSAKTGYGARYAGSANGLRTVSLSKVLNGGSGIPDYLWDVRYYDEEAREVLTVASTHLGGIERYRYNYSFSSELLAKEIEHKSAAGQNATTLVEKYTHTYDAMGRPLVTRHQVGSNTVRTISNRTYDIIGRLSGDSRNGATGLSSSYHYNIRSWTERIEGTLFSQDLYYQSNPISDAPQWGGNISAISWQGAGESTARRYAFTYDGFARLTNAVYSEESGSNSGAFNESLTYDANGNPLTHSIGSAASLAYILSGNQILQLNGIAFSYDAKGREITGGASGNILTAYNLLDLPQTISVKSGSTVTNALSYSYDSGRRKLMEAETVASNSRKDYVGSLIYKDGTLDRIRLDGDLGFVTFSGSTPQYHYFIKDYQGNNRILASESGTAEQVYSYYPFGTLHQTGQGGSQSTVSNDFLYSGKEYNSTTGLYDFLNRFQSPSTARFTVMDPMAEKYYGISPYAYCGSNPVNYIDPDGRFILPDVAWDLFNVGLGIKSLKDNIQAGNVGWAVVDALGIAGDVVMAAIPGLPGGLGTAIKAASKADKIADRAEAIGDTIKNGKWIKTNEYMPPASASYQSFITGKSANESFLLNGTKFDGITDNGVLLEVKGEYAQFLDPAKKADFHSWWDGSNGLVMQARRQLEAAKGNRIEWYFKEENVAEAVRTLFEREGVNGIEIYYKPMK